MNKFAWTVLAVGSLIGGACFFLFFDRCLFFEARPPATAEVVDNSDAKLATFEIDGQDCLKSPLIVAPGATTKVQGTLSVDMQKWRWPGIGDPRRMTPEMSEAKRLRDMSLPGPMIVVELLCMSSLGNGEAVASRSILTVLRRGTDEAVFPGRFQIPDRAGEYRLRVRLAEAYMGERRKEGFSNVRSIKSFNIRVVAPK